MLVGDGHQSIQYCGTWHGVKAGMVDCKLDLHRGCSWWFLYCQFQFFLLEQNMYSTCLKLILLRPWWVQNVSHWKTWRAWPKLNVAHPKDVLVHNVNKWSHWKSPFGHIWPCFPRGCWCDQSGGSSATSLHNGLLVTAVFLLHSQMLEGIVRLDFIFHWSTAPMTHPPHRQGLTPERQRHSRNQAYPYPVVEAALPAPSRPWVTTSRRPWVTKSKPSWLGKAAGINVPEASGKWNYRC